MQTILTAPQTEGEKITFTLQNVENTFLVTGFVPGVTYTLKCTAGNYNGSVWNEPWWSSMNPGDIFTAPFEYSYDFDAYTDRIEFMLQSWQGYEDVTLEISMDSEPVPDKYELKIEAIGDKVVVSNIVNDVLFDSAELTKANSYTAPLAIVDKIYDVKFIGSLSGSYPNLKIAILNNSYNF